MVLSLSFLGQEMSGGPGGPDLIAVELKWLGKAVGILVGRGADARRAQELVREVRQRVEMDRFSSVVMQVPETAAVDGLLKLGEEVGVSLKGLLPMLGKRSVMPAAGPKKGKNFGGDIDLTALQFPDGLFKNADGSHATVHREWAMAKSGLFLAPLAISSPSWRGRWKSARTSAVFFLR